MQSRGTCQMGEDRLGAVEQLQHEKVDNFTRTAVAGLRQTAGQRIAALVQQTYQLIGKRPQPRRSTKIQARRAIVRIEHHPVVGTAFHDSRDTQHAVCLRDFAGERQTQPQLSHLHQGTVVQTVAVPGLVVLGTVTRKRVWSGFVIDFGHAMTPQGQRQNHQHIASVTRHVERERQVVFRRQADRRPVGQHCMGCLQRQLAQAELLLIDCQAGEPPSVRAQPRDPGFQLALQVAVVLLQMLWLQEHPLRPHHLVFPRHVDSFPVVLSRAHWRNRFT